MYLKLEWDLRLIYSPEQTYELRHLALYTLMFVALTHGGQWAAGLIHWFPKGNIHSIVLLLLSTYGISKDKRIFGERPSVVTQAVSHTLL
jgi:hypothetical protein